MHYQRYTDSELAAAIAGAETLLSIVHTPMSEDTDKWDFLCSLEAELAAMRHERVTRAMPAERIAIPVEVEAA